MATEPAERPRAPLILFTRRQLRKGSRQKNLCGVRTAHPSHATYDSLDPDEVDDGLEDVPCRRMFGDDPPMIMGVMLRNRARDKMRGTELLVAFLAHQSTLTRYRGVVRVPEDMVVDFLLVGLLELPH